MGAAMLIARGLPSRPRSEGIAGRRLLVGQSPEAIVKAWLRLDIHGWSAWAAKAFRGFELAGPKGSGTGDIFA
jgi:hypothetical protein